MAWRDSRGQRGVLALFVLCIVFGIGAVVAIWSLQSNLEATIAAEAKGLVGADLRLQTRSPFTPALEDWITAQGGETSREVQFRSMAWFPSVEESRFVQVRALEPGFPFYGAIETTPAEVDFRAESTPSGLPLALIEAGLMGQFALEPGDVVRLGGEDFEIAAALDRVAGESELSGFFAPRIFIPWSSLDATGLLQPGSVASFRVYFRFEEGLSEARQEVLEVARKEVFLDAGVRVTTVEDRQASIQRVLDNLFAYLGLVGFIALLLGGLGVGGAVQVYLQPKLAQVATLRSLGASSRAAFSVYLLQIMAAGAGGAILGTALGVAVQRLLPVLLGPFLPFEVALTFDPRSIVFGLVFGWLAATLFALRPLLAVRQVSPLQALRADFEEKAPRRDPAAMSVTLLIVVLGVGFACWQAPVWWQGLAFAAGLAIAFGLLAGAAAVLRELLRKLTPRRAPYAVRLALSNLYRPRNRTVFVVTTLGLGAFLIATLALTRASLLDQVATNDSGADQPNLILVDVQPDQIDGVQAVLAANGAPAVETLPVVTMRVRGIKGRSLREWREMPDSPVDDWVYSWEFRVTYRDHILPNAEIINGTFVGSHPDGSEPVPISLSDGLLDDFDVTVGDEIEWDVQGLPMKTVVSSVRQIDWELGRQNFGVLWPTGVLEGAPTLYALTARTETREATLELQRALAADFSNVSLLDLSLVFETIEEVLGRISFVIQFMAAFTVLTGLVVLFGAMATSRYQRQQECVLLRTMGAQTGFIRMLLTIEYALLGLLASSIGVGLSLLAAAAVTTWVFEIPFVVEWGSVLGIFVAVSGLTVISGWLNSRGLVKAPPLQILRSS
jgi:putative ABC transport system permease protein